MEPSDALHLGNIADFCDDIDTALQELSITRETFDASSTQKGVLAFFVEHIGEEAGKLSKSFMESNPEIEWAAIVNFRHRIVHAYAKIDPDVLWDTVQTDIPELHAFCAKKLQEIEE